MENQTTPDRLYGLEYINELIAQLKTDPETESKVELVSDGFHNFRELYLHRGQLFIALCQAICMLKKLVSAFPFRVWRAEQDADGKQYPGWFLLCIEKQDQRGVVQQISYHMPTDVWDFCGQFVHQTYKTAPSFDGHTSEDVLSRLARIFS